MAGKGNDDSSVIELIKEAEEMKQNLVRGWWALQGMALLLINALGNRGLNSLTVLGIYQLSFSFLVLGNLTLMCLPQQKHLMELGLLESKSQAESCENNSQAENCGQSTASSNPETQPSQGKGTQRLASPLIIREGKVQRGKSTKNISTS